MFAPDEADEAGFTVLELMIAMLIMLVITVPLVTSFVLGLTTTRDGLQDVTNSADAQALAGFFDVDVASSETVQGVSASCDDPARPALLRLQWTDDAVTHVVTYRLAAATVTAQADVREVEPTTVIQQLERVSCSSAGPPQTTAVARSVVGTPVFRCDGAPCGGAPSRPRAVSLQADEFSALFNNIDPTVAQPARRYTIGLTATRKVTTA